MLQDHLFERWPVVEILHQWVPLLRQRGYRFISTEQMLGGPVWRGLTP